MTQDLMGNVFSDLPGSLPEEQVFTLLEHGNASIRRIVSTGQSSPPNGWYDQPDDEWVMILQGQGILGFPDEPDRHMQAGDYCYIPAGKRHRVEWTPVDQLTIWLAVHFPAGQPEA